MIHLIFLRHAECLSMKREDHETMVSDAENVLTPSGSRSVLDVAATLRSNFTALEITSSPVIRAQQTAEMLAGAFETSIAFDSRLREREFGFNSKTLVCESKALQIEAVMNPNVRISSGETVEEHRLRMTEWFEEFSSKLVDGKNYLIVSHGGSIEHLFSILVGSPISHLSRVFVRCDPCHFQHWSKVPINSGKSIWRLNSVNACSFT